MSDLATIELKVREEEVMLQLFSTGGKKLGTLLGRNLSPGIHEQVLDLSYLPPGNYYLLYINGLNRSLSHFIKL